VTRLIRVAVTGRYLLNSDLGMPTVRRSRASDWSDVRQLLISAELPIDDLQPRMLEHFLLAESADEIVGLIGLQIHETIGLLRSLVVSTGARRSGLGGKLVDALELAAQAAGITELWLLTIDAEKFFERQGFDIVTRDEAPDSIRQSEEFADLCPGSAYLMMKKLNA
jgi:amino-acid N-acetyltransferase